MIPTIKWPQRLPALVGVPGPDEIHLWLTDVDAPPINGGLLFGTLSPLEQERARRFVFGEHRRRHLAAKAWTRCVLGSYLNLEPRDVPLNVDTHGKPHVAVEANADDVRFSLSHCGRLALLAVTVGQEVGVDLQDTLSDESWPGVAERFFTMAEQEHLRALPHTTRAFAFAEIWTRKEAAAKAAGTGLTSRVFSIAVGTSDWGMIDCGEGLQVWSLPARGRFAAAVAVQRGRRPPVRPVDGFGEVKTFAVMHSGTSWF